MRILGKLHLVYLTILFICSGAQLYSQTVIQNNTTLNNLFGADQKYYQIEIPAGKTKLTIQTFSSDVGDCDVYVSRGRLPSRSSYDFQSSDIGNNESITVDNPQSGTWYILLYPYEPYLSLTLSVAYSGGIDTNVSVGGKFWDYDLPGYIYSSPAVGSDGTIYAGIATSVGGANASICAISADGTSKWQRNLSYSSVYATPAVGPDGSVFVVTQTGNYGQLYCLDPDGNTKWRFNPSVHPKHPVAISSAGTIFVASDANNIYAVNSSSAAISWQFTAESGFYASTPVVIAPDGSIYCGFYDPARNIGRMYGINKIGNKIWQFDVANRVNTPAIDAKGTIIFGVPYPIGKVYAINSNGTKKWESSLAGTPYVLSPPVIANDGTLYISSNQELFALNPATGNVKWIHYNGVLLVETVYANGPAVDSSGIIYYGSLGGFESGSLYAVSPAGNTVWSYNAGGEIACQPAITVDGKILFSATDGRTRKIFALKGGNPPAQSAWPLARRNVANTGSLDGLGATIVSQPLGSTVKVGDAFGFTVTASGLQPILYQWRKDGVPIATATNPSYAISKVTTNHTGNYTVTVSNSFGNNLSSNAFLLVDGTRPVITIVSPAPNVRLQGRDAVFKGTVVDNSSVSQVFFQLNNDAWKPATGLTSWEAAVSLAPGTNVFRIYAIDIVGNISSTNSQSLVYVLTAPLQVKIVGAGSVITNFDGQFLELGRTYSMTAKPALGFGFVGWSGGYSTNSQTLTFSMASNLVLTANFADNQKPSVQIQSPVGGLIFTNGQALTLMATATDNVAVEKLEFYDGANNKATYTTPPYSFIWNFGVNDNGTHLWTARAYDHAGNVSTSAPISLQVKIDTIPPFVGITTPVQGQAYTSSSIIASGTASDLGQFASGVGGVEVRINGGIWVVATGTTNWSRALSLFPCDNIIEVRSRDRSGNYSQISMVNVSNGANNPPQAPMNLTPGAGAQNVSITPTLSASPFIDGDCGGDTHMASQWQILTSSGGIIVDSGTNQIDKRQWTVPAGKLTFGSTYTWRVRYQDNHGAWSSNSIPTTITTEGPALSGRISGSNFVFKWKTNAPGFLIQVSTNLLSDSWANISPGAYVVNGELTFTNAMTNSTRFFRLKK